MLLTPFGKRFVKNYSEESIELEHRLAEIIYQQEVMVLNSTQLKLNDYIVSLPQKEKVLNKNFKDSFPDWEVRTPFIPKSK